MDKNKISNFLTPDISYLLGLITGRGEIQYNQDVKKIIIDFEYKSQKVTGGRSLDLDQKLHIQTSLDQVIVRLQNIGINVAKNVDLDLGYRHSRNVNSGKKVSGYVHKISAGALFSF